MKIAISGCTGLIASHLIPLLVAKKHFIIPITRNTLLPENSERLSELLVSCDAVINLAGSPINKHWTKSTKKEILNSRIQTTRTIIASINKLEQKPKLFLNASAVGIYPSGASCDESWTNYGNDFLANVCKKWEEESSLLPKEVRSITLRFGIILDAKGGALPKIIQPFKYNLGGKIGSGNQGFSWIHITDASNAIIFLLESEHSSGVYNITSPDNCTNYHFSRKVANLLKCSCLFTIPGFILKFILGEQSSLLLEGQFVQPKRLLSEGFQFEYPSLEEALIHLLKINN